jgi:hypothetical protein
MNCHMLKVPKIICVYVYPNGGAGEYRQRGAQFAASHSEKLPGIPHETLVVCNGVGVNDDTRELFARLPQCSFIDHDNSGWDIGGFLLAARTVPCDLMVFFGSHTYFRKPGWLARMLEIYLERGVALYGCTGNQGDLRVGVHPHIRTTGFWCPPSLLAAYPHPVTSTGGGGQRYQFEHGQNCLTNWVKGLGMVPWVVGWNDVKHVDVCDSMPNGYHQGDQSNLLVGDRLTAPPYYHAS